MAETSGQESQQSQDAYGQPISAERQAELQNILDAWNAPDADHGARKGPFDCIRAYWGRCLLARRAEWAR